MVSRLSNETLTILLEDVRQDLKDIKHELKNVNNKVTTLSNGQSLLGGTFHELRDVCQERWNKFEMFEQEYNNKTKLEKELKKSKIFYFIHQNKKFLITSIPWILIIATALYAFITNNSDLLKTIITKFSL